MSDAVSTDQGHEVEDASWDPFLSGAPADPARVSADLFVANEMDRLSADGVEETADGASSDGSGDDAPSSYEESSYEESSYEERAGEEILSAGDHEDAEKLPLSASIGALLFVATRPLSVQALQELTGRSGDEVEAALVELGEIYNGARTGVTLVEVAGAYQLRSLPALARVVHRLIPPRARRLSRAAAETLAIVAYKQPVQRAEIEAIRGVDAAPTLKTLLDAKLVRVVGREDTVGQPALYGTTSTFLEKFGLRDLSELPSARELARIVDDPGESEAGNDEGEQRSAAGGGADTSFEAQPELFEVEGSR